MSPPPFQCKSLDCDIYAEAGTANRFVAELLSPRRKRLQKCVVLLLGILGRFCAVCICKSEFINRRGPLKLLSTRR